MQFRLIFPADPFRQPTRCSGPIPYQGLLKQIQIVNSDNYRVTSGQADTALHNIAKDMFDVDKIHK
jgi:hypothetical protein